MSAYWSWIQDAGAPRVFSAPASSIAAGSLMMCYGLLQKCLEQKFWFLGAVCDKYFPRPLGNVPAAVRRHPFVT